MKLIQYFKCTLPVFLCPFILVGCIAQDVYPKYQIMKSEALWIGQFCNVSERDLKVIYKGSAASIRLECKVATNSWDWQNNFENELKQRGYKFVNETYPVQIYCFKKTGIEFHYFKESNLKFGFFYPNNVCPK